MNNDIAFVGLSCTGHDGAVAIVQGGQLVFAEATERYRQNKFAVGQAPDDYLYCRDVLARHSDGDRLIVAKSWSDQATQIWHGENKRLRESIEQQPQHRAVLENLAQFHQHNWDGFMGPSIALAGHGVQRAAHALGRQVMETRHYDHHLCHAAFGAWGAPFNSAAVIVMDGQGEGRGTAFWQYREGALHPVEVEPYDGTLVECYSSLGLYYGIIVCLACGFEPVSGEEWKIMGLAPYGTLDEALYRKLKTFYTVDGLSVKCTELTVDVFLDIVSHPVSHRTDFQKAANYAYTFQRFFTETATALMNELGRRTGETNLIVAGGCGLNSSFNGRIVDVTGFRNVHIPSAPADDGNAAGAAILAARDYREAISGPSWQSPYLGSQVKLDSLETVLENSPFVPFTRIDDEQSLADEVARRIADGQVVGWMQGRAEFGPRALGNRSILADPRDVRMKDKVNRVVKFREAFRPFAPSVLHEAGEAWFEQYQDSPYMERTLRFRDALAPSVPAVCHADQTGRVQSVTAERNPAYYRLIKAFESLTGVPMLMNTSLNVMGKPIVHSAEDALQVFLGSQLDCMVIGPYLLAKDLAPRKKALPSATDQRESQLQREVVA
ncbi:carbamoyltransferase family protein [Pseudomonas sp.]|uniref:carbamoyltransferase family protein n=1 Tax=Pseudomonas sp. TaxID=306 RepID=UPI003D6E1528